MKNLKKTFLFFIALGTLTIASAQPAFEEEVDDTAPIPGIVIAVLAGLFIGGRKIYLNRNK